MLPNSPFNPANWKRPSIFSSDPLFRADKDGKNASIRQTELREERLNAGKEDHGITIVSSEESIQLSAEREYNMRLQRQRSNKKKG